MNQDTAEGIGLIDTIDDRQQTVCPYIRQTIMLCSVFWLQLTLGYIYPCPQCLLLLIYAQRIFAVGN